MFGHQTYQKILISLSARLGGKVVKSEYPVIIYVVTLLITSHDLSNGQCLMSLIVNVFKSLKPHADITGSVTDWFRGIHTASLQMP